MLPKSKKDRAREAVESGERRAPSRGLAARRASSVDILPPSKRDDALGASREQERGAASRYGGRLTPGSGSKPIKGDVHLTDLRVMVECKTTETASYRVALGTLEKLSVEACAAGMSPALEFQIRGGEASSLTERTWVAVPASTFESLVRAARAGGMEIEGSDAFSRAFGGA